MFKKVGIYLQTNFNMHPDQKLVGGWTTNLKTYATIKLDEHFPQKIGVNI